MLSAPMLAALAIGLAETASAAPVDPQPSVPGAGSKSASAPSRYHPAGAPSASIEHGLAEAGLHPTTSLAPSVEETYEETYTAPSAAPPDAKTVAEMEHVMAGMHDIMSDIKDRVAAIDSAQIDTNRAIMNNT
jgi:hypothetical protein